MSDPIFRGGTSAIFPVLMSGAFMLYGVRFTDIGHPPPGTVSTITYFLNSVFHPPVYPGVVPAISGSLFSMFLFNYVGTAETAMMSELALLMIVVLAIIVFDTSPATKEYSGMGLVMAGVYLVQSDGGAA